MKCSDSALFMLCKLQSYMNLYIAFPDSEFAILKINQSCNLDCNRTLNLCTLNNIQNIIVKTIYCVVVHLILQNEDIGSTIKKVRQLFDIKDMNQRLLYSIRKAEWFT